MLVLLCLFIFVFNGTSGEAWKGGERDWNRDGCKRTVQKAYNVYNNLLASLHKK